MNFNKSRHGVELHLHLDGGSRPATIFKYAKQKNILVPGNDAVEFESSLIVKQPNSLGSFLKTFDYLLPPIVGDAEAITQVTLDFLEDCVNKGGLGYVEPRFSPHFFAGNGLSVDEATKTVLSALERGSEMFDIQCRAILCMMRHCPKWSDEVVSLAMKYQPHGVVAVDVAGDDKPCDGTNTDALIKSAFQKAHKNGLHCIAHAGENGCAASVTEAVYEMYSERIGHGYHILEDATIYSDTKTKNIHFEVCPLSSRLTGSVTCDWTKHPVHYFLRDNINFSFSTDDPTVTGQWLLAEKKMLTTEVGVTHEQIQQANLRAANACFLKADEKEDLLNHLRTKGGSGSISSN
uniref:adenosine deaminase n=1 Tax=Ictalurus punctatus TaxID=7998 RepID=E3TF47_ICTPU|nr:adenosine deaminase [Ictalurus punctatus]ADO28933.1 adenosine deaminase [Ictalurus punctatus]